MRYLGINDLMFQVLMQVTVLVIFCVMLKQSLSFFLPFVLGYKNVWKINGGKFNIQYSLNFPAGTILCLCVSFLSLFFLPNISNPHAPTLECMNLPWQDCSRSQPHKGGI